MVTLLASIGFFAAWILAGIYSGWILKTLWSWFVVPTFGLPTLTIPTAIGLSITVRWLTHAHRPSKEDESKGFAEKWIEDIFTAVVFGLLTLLVGWICKQYM